MDDRNSEGFSTITPEEARAMMDDGDVVILDVREPSEFATGHVPGAINVPLGEIRMGRTLPECPDLLPLGPTQRHRRQDHGSERLPRRAQLPRRHPVALRARALNAAFEIRGPADSDCNIGQGTISI